MLPKDLKKYFWDVDSTKLDFKKNSGFIIARVLEYGDIETIQWLFRTFDAEEIKKVFIKRRGFSLRTANFWRIFFNIDRSKIASCLKKSYQKAQKTHWPF